MLFKLPLLVRERKRQRKSDNAKWNCTVILRPYCFRFENERKTRNVCNEFLENSEQIRAIHTHGPVCTRPFALTLTREREVNEVGGIQSKTCASIRTRTKRTGHQRQEPETYKNSPFTSLLDTMKALGGSMLPGYTRVYIHKL